MTSIGVARQSAGGAADLQNDRTLRRVSSISIWSDVIWYLETATPGRRERIGWSFLLPDGSRSTDPQHSRLLESFREAFWGMLSDGLWYGKTLHVGSSGPFAVGMRELFMWLVWRGHSTVAALNSEEQQMYLEDLPALIVDREGFYSSKSTGLAEYSIDGGEYAAKAPDDEDEGDAADEELELSESPAAAADDEASSGSDDSISFHQAYIRLVTLYYLYAQGPVLVQAGLDQIPEEPFHGQRVGLHAGSVASHVAVITPPLPDEVALPLLGSVLKWLDHYSEDVLRLQDEYFQLKRNLVAQGYSEETIKKHLSKLLRSYEFRVDADSKLPWHPRLGRMAAKQFRHLLLRLRDACVLALEYFVGMRVSEICSIKHRETGESGLPRCIEVKKSKSGLLNLFFVNGLLSKGQKVPVPEQWLLGCTPVGSKELPPAVRCIALLARLFEPWRESEKFDALVGAFTTPHSLPWNSGASNSLSLNLLKGKRRFLSEWVNLSGLPNFGRSGENLGMYRDTRGACIRSHHGRKTFSAYILESRTSLLVAVSRHFKHLTTAITEASYFAPVTRLRQEAESARTAATVSYFVEVLEGRRIYGRMAELVYKYFGSSDWKEIRSKVELFAKVAEIVNVHGLQIYFSSHANCMIRANPLESRCRAADTDVSWLNDDPQFAARTPSMCAGCGCSLMDASHLPFWRARAAATFDDRPAVSNEFRVQIFRRDQARKMVRVLEA